MGLVCINATGSDVTKLTQLCNKILWRYIRECCLEVKGIISKYSYLNLRRKLTRAKIFEGFNFK